jgi:hypothetical protein
MDEADEKELQITLRFIEAVRQAKFGDAGSESQSTSSRGDEPEAHVEETTVLLSFCN